MYHYFSRYEQRLQEKITAKRDQYLRPLLGVLSRAGVKADYLTYLSIVSLILGALIITKLPILGGIGFLTYCLMDGVDGPLSRYQKRDSPRGSILDIFADQVGVVVLPMFSMIYFGSDAVFGYLFGLFYLLYIIFIVILNSKGISLAFVLRVKYVYYLLFFFSAYYSYDLLSWFYRFFGSFYTVSSVLLFRRILRLYEGEPKGA